jgi:hypothetical protein
MSSGTLTTDAMQKLMDRELFRTPRFRADILAYAELNRTRLGTHFRLKDQTLWHPLIPFVALSDVLEAIGSFSAKFPTSLISFPEVLLRDVVTSPFVFALSYHILFRGSEPAVNLVLSLLLDLREFVGDEVTVQAASLAELIRVMPMSLSAKIGYCGADPKSIIDLTAARAERGAAVLRVLGILREVGATMDRDRARALAMKRAQRTEFERMQGAFMSKAEFGNEAEDECPVCHSQRDDAFVFPMAIFRSQLAGMVDGVERMGIGFHMCVHAMHRRCLDGHVCPSDRCFRNCFLPRDDCDRIGEATEEDAELRGALASSDEQLVDALRDLVVLLEVRARVKPEVVDKSVSKLLLRYFFLWLRRLGVRAEGTDPVGRMLAALVRARRVPTTIEEFAAYAVGKGAAFDRRAEIVRGLVLGIGGEVALAGRELPPFRFHETPENFLAFIKEPFRVDLSVTEDKKTLSLLTGKVGGMTWTISGFDVKLCLTGGYAAEVVIKSDLMIRKARGIYVSDLGDEDIGMKRGDILYYSRENAEALMETVLSGEWVDCPAKANYFGFPE